MTADGRFEPVPHLGEVPARWQVLPIRRLATTRAGSGFPHDLQGVEGSEVEFHKVRSLGMIDELGNVRASQDTISRSVAASLGAVVFPAGTLILAKVGAALLLGRVAALTGPSCIDNNMFGVTANAGWWPRFAFWSMSTVPFDYLVNPGAVPSLSDRNFLGYRLAVPPLEEQRQIAAFLDRETSKIDALIGKQEQLIETLRERRDAAWAAVFDQIDTTSVGLQIRRVLSSIVDGPFGSSLTSAHYSSEGTRVIRLGNIGVNEFRDADAVFIPSAYGEVLSAHSVTAGDVVIAGLGDDRMPLGRAVVVPDLGPAIVKADCYRARPNRLVSAEYLAWAMSAPQVRLQIGLLARGATRARLNTSTVQQVVIPVPDATTQSWAVAETARLIVKIDVLVEKARRFIELSKERRSALISAAVTGQIDVRDKAGSGVNAEDVG